MHCVLFVDLVQFRIDAFLIREKKSNFDRNAHKWRIASFRPLWRTSALRNSGVKSARTVLRWTKCSDGFATVWITILVLWHYSRPDGGTACSWNRTWYSLSVLCNRESRSWCHQDKLTSVTNTGGGMEIFWVYFIIIIIIIIITFSRCTCTSERRAMNINRTKTQIRKVEVFKFEVVEDFRSTNQCQQSGRCYLMVRAL